MTFILASASPRRLDLLKQIGLVPAEVAPAEIDETPHKNELPQAYAMRVTEAKARAVAALRPGKSILAADTVVCMGRRILPKAEDAKTARRCLVRLSGRRHTVMTAVGLLAADGKYKVKLAESVVRFKRLSEDEIEVYIASDEWQGKAGGYAIQGVAAAFIPFISGSYSNIVGLPLAETASLFR